MQHPLIRTKPDMVCKATHLNPVRAESSDRTQRRPSDDLLDELMAHRLHADVPYRRKCSAGDPVMWDNRSVLHQANHDYDCQHNKRRLLRMALEGERPR